MDNIVVLPSDAPNILSIEFSGNINENCNIFSLDLNNVTNLNINLSGLKYINSVGVKSWVQWANQNAKNLTVSLNHCTVLFVNQINLVVGFLPKNFLIESFDVPYFCEKCSTETKLLLSKDVDFFNGTEDRPKKIVLPSVLKCEKDKGEMDLDVIYIKYFSFLDFKK